jgi:hypothetical protein
MPSLRAYVKLKVIGLDVETRYNLTDTLACAEDLELLFYVLRKHKDHFGNSAVFTAVSVVANLDLEMIKAANFTEYQYGPFTETLKRYNRESAIPLWKQSI